MLLLPLAVDLQNVWYGITPSQSCAGKHERFNSLPAVRFTVLIRSYSNLREERKRERERERDACSFSTGSLTVQHVGQPCLVEARISYHTHVVPDGMNRCRINGHLRYRSSSSVVLPGWGYRESEASLKSCTLCYSGSASQQLRDSGGLHDPLSTLRPFSVALLPKRRQSLPGITEDCHKTAFSGFLVFYQALAWGSVAFCLHNTNSHPSF